MTQPHLPPPERPSGPPSIEALDDPRLLASAREGDDAAFAALIERHDPLLRLLSHHLLDGRDTDRVLIDAYVKAYRGLGRQRGEALPWLTRTTYLTCLDRVRRREQRRRGGPGRKPQPSEGPASANPLGRLPSDQRAVVALVDGCSVEPDVVARTLAVPVHIVNALLDQGRRALDGRPTRLLASPDPSPEFWRRLGTQLLLERASPAAPVPRLPDPDRQSAAERRIKAPPLAMQRRAPRRRKFRPEDSSPDSVEGLADGARRQRVRLSTRARTALGRGLVVILAAAVIAGAVFGVVRVASRARTPVRENSVAEISRRSTAALAQLDTFATTVTRTVVGPGGRRVDRFRLMRNRAGSFLTAGTGPTASVAYDAPTDTLWRSPGTLGARSAPAGAREMGLAAGPPDPSGFDPSLPDAEVGFALRTFAEVADVAAVARRVDGVDSWVLEAAVPEESRVQGIDRVTLVVDRARLAPVRVSYAAGEVVVRALTFGDVVLDGLVPSTFAVDPGAGVRPVDRGFRTVALTDVDAAVGRSPLRPSFLPAGYELAAVTVRTEGATVALRYQRGFERIVVTTRSSPVARGTAWPDPFDRGGDLASAAPSIDSVALDEGPFRQTTAQRVTAVGALPSLWGTDGTVAFTVSGDLDADQLERVAESLRP